jgi:uncharacterized membrane protein
MSDEQISKEIDQYINRLRKKLPESFETEDLLDDLRIHILEAFAEKQESADDRMALLKEVIANLGTPEEIAEEFGQVKISEPEPEKRPFQGRGLIIRLLAAIIVVVLASWVVSVATEGAVDFLFAVIVLMIFVIAEWSIRAWQMSEYQRLDTETEDKRHTYRGD